MSSPGGDEVARVSVRVVPDVSHFREELRRELASLKDENLKIPVKLDLDKADLERQLKELNLKNIDIPVNFKVENVRDDIKRATDAAKPDPINIPVDLDEARLQAEMAKVKAQLDELDNRKVTPHVELLQASFRAQLAELNAELDKLRAAKVGIPVDADTNAAKAAVFDLKAVLADLEKNPVQVKFDADAALLQRKIAEVEAALKELDGKTVTPDVELEANKATVELINLRRQLDALDNKRIKAIAELDANTIRADARIKAFVERMRLTRKIELPVDVDKRSIADTSTRIGRLFSGLGDRLAGLFDGIGGSIGGVADNIVPITKGTIAAGQAAIQAAVAFATWSGIAAGLVVIGAGITAAYGTAATAVAALPAALGLIAAPAVAVMLGLDGIKKAAQSIKPEFDKLKASVSDVFEKGLTPQFQQLATIFPKVTDSIKNVASAIVSTAFTITQLVTSATGVAQINTIFNSAAQAIRNMQPGIRDIISGFLILASQTGVFDALTAAVNTFGQAFKNNLVATIRDGSLTAAFAGLKDSLSLLAQGFADLVKNGIELFAAAAPGLNSFLQDIIGFFDRFNWQSLGASVGGVFRGLGDAIQSIPQGTIAAIEASFSRLATTFQSAQFAAAIRGMAAAIPIFLSAANLLIESFVRIGLGATGLVQVLTGIGRTIAAIGAGLADPVGLVSGKYKDEFDKASKEVNDGFAKIGQAFSSFSPPPIQSIGPAVSVGIVQPLHDAVPAVQAALSNVHTVVTEQTGKIPPTMIVSLHNADEAIKSGVKDWESSAQTGAAAVPPAVSGELDKVPPAANTALAPLQQLEALKGMKDQFTLAAADSMHAMSVGVQSGMAEVQQQFQTGLDTASSGVNTSFGLISQGFTIGMAGLAATVTSGMPAIQAAFNFTGIGAQIGTVFLGLIGTFTNGMASLAGAVTGGIPLIQAAFNFTGITAQIGTVFLGLIGTFTTGMASIAASVTAGMVLVQQAFATGFSTALTGAITTGFAGLKVATDAGMLSIIDAIRLGGTLMQATLHVAIGLMATDVAAQFVLVQSATVDGMQSIVDTISGSMPAVNSAFDMTALSLTVGLAFQSLVGTFTVGMASIAVAVTSGMATASASMSAGMAGMAAAASAGMTGVTSAIMAGMAVAIAAIDAAGRLITASAQQSMAGFGTAIQAGMAAAQATISAATQDMLAKIQNLGTQMATIATQSMLLFANGVRIGMNQSVTAVQDGVNRMIAALRSGTGQFSSIGVQMMNGLRAGILSQAGSIAAAAASVVSGAIAAARAAAAVHSPSRAFMDIGAFMGEGLAIGLEDSAPRVAAAADKLANAAVDTADKITAAFSGDSLGADLSAKVEHSFSDATSNVSTKDVVGQLRALNGNVDQSSYLSAIIALLQAIASQGQGGNAAMGAQTSRRYAELGAF